MLVTTRIITKQKPFSYTEWKIWGPSIHNNGPSCLPFHEFEPVPITIPLPVSTESSNLSKSPPESIMPLTIMENTKTDLETGGDLPRLNHQPELRVSS